MDRLIEKEVFKSMKYFLPLIVVVLFALVAPAPVLAECSGVYPSLYTAVECSPFQTIECYDQTSYHYTPPGKYCVCNCVLMGSTSEAITCNRVGNATYWDCIERAETDGTTRTDDEARLCRIESYLANDACYLPDFN